MGQLSACSVWNAPHAYPMLFACGVQKQKPKRETSGFEVEVELPWQLVGAVPGGPSFVYL